MTHDLPPIQKLAMQLSAAIEEAAVLSGRTPDPAKVARVVSRAVVVRFKAVRFGVLA